MFSAGNTLGSQNNKYFLCVVDFVCYVVEYVLSHNIKLASIIMLLFHCDLFIMVAFCYNNEALSLYL